MLPNSEASLVDTLGSLLAGLQPSSAHNIVKKSELRRPSVDAVTSAATSSSAPLTLSSEPFSLSDSCAAENNSDSELSYNVSEGGLFSADRKQKVTKKKETFSERLKAALARGNTPDESDDASAAAPNPLRRVKVPMNQRAVRRQVPKIYEVR